MEQHSQAFRVIDKIDRYCNQYTEEFTRKLALGDDFQDQESSELVISKNLCFASCVTPRETELAINCLQSNNGDHTRCKSELETMWKKYKDFWTYYMDSPKAEQLFDDVSEECLKTNRQLDQVIAKEPENTEKLDQLQRELFKCEAKTRFPKDWDNFEKCISKNKPGECENEFKTLLDSFERSSLGLLDVFQFNNHDREAVKEMGTQLFINRMGKIIEAGTRAIPSPPTK